MLPLWLFLVDFLVLKVFQNLALKCKLFPPLNKPPQRLRSSLSVAQRQQQPLSGTFWPGGVFLLLIVCFFTTSFINRFSKLWLRGKGNLRVGNLVPAQNLWWPCSNPYLVPQIQIVRVSLSYTNPSLNQWYLAGNCQNQKKKWNLEFWNPKFLFWKVSFSFLKFWQVTELKSKPF